MPALPRPDLPPGAHRDLVAALHDLHHRAGWPSLRSMAKTAGCSPTTVSTVFSSARLPSWGLIEVLVEEMDGDPATFRALWLAAGSDPDSRGDGHIDLAGRRDELTEVRRHLESGSGLLLVAGEAGIGKTHLVSAAAASCQTAVAFGRCLPLSNHVPLLPVIDVLRGVNEVDDGAWLAKAMDGCPPSVRDAIALLVPELSDVPPKLEDGWGLSRLFVAVDSALKALDVLRPLALVLEDLHWADATTLDFLEHAVSASSVRVVATYRMDDPDVAPRNTDWYLRARRLPSTHVVTLGPLDKRETQEQLALLLGQPPQGALVQRIFARSKGQPLFTEQLARGDRERDELPTLLANLLDDRLGLLGNDAWKVARALGLADRPLETGVLAHASGLDGDSTTAALRELQRRHLLAEAGPKDEPALRHPLMAEAIRRRLIPGEGTVVHARLATALAGRADASPAEVARHWAGAHDDEQELIWQVRAAEVASDRFALDELFVALDRVLSVWPPGAATLPDVEYAHFELYAFAIDNATALGRADAAIRWAHEAMALDLADDQRADILRMAGEVQFRSGDPTKGMTLLDRALALHQTIPPSMSFVHALGWRTRHLIELGRWNEARVDAGRGLELAMQLDLPDSQQELHGLLGQLAGLSGEYAEATEHFAVARSIAVRLVQDVPAEVRLAVRQVDMLARTSAAPPEIVEVASGPLSAAERIGFDSDVACVLTLQVCEALLRAGDVRGAARLVESVPRGEVTFALGPRHLARALVALREGRLDESLTLQAAVAALGVPTTTDDAWAVHHADIELWNRRAEAASKRLDRALMHLLEGDAWRTASPVASMCARAHADQAVEGELSVAERRAIAERLRSTVDRPETSPLSRSAVGAAVQADAATWRAELNRLTGAANVEAWSRAAVAWDRLGRPHDAAYCRWRGAEVALARGQGTVAGRLLKRAAHDARQHVPLSGAIAETAAYAARS